MTHTVMNATMAGIVVAGLRYILPGLALSDLTMTVAGIFAAFLVAIRLIHWAVTHRAVRHHG